jgi:KilA-N domain
MESLMIREFGTTAIGQRVKDGYTDATAMCQATGKEWTNFRENKSTEDFTQALASNLQIPSSALVQSIRGQGTWVHPRIAIHLAMWCSAHIAVQVTGWVEEWYRTKDNPLAQHGRKSLPFVALFRGTAMLAAQEAIRPDGQPMPGHLGGQPASASTLSHGLFATMVRGNARPQEEFTDGRIGKALEQEILCERDGLFERLPWRRRLLHRAGRRASLRGLDVAPVVCHGRHTIHDGETPEPNRQPYSPAVHRMIPPQSPRACRRALIDQHRSDGVQAAAVVTGRRSLQLSV